MMLVQIHFSILVLSSYRGYDRHNIILLSIPSLTVISCRAPKNSTTTISRPERAFGHKLVASCRTPLAAYATWRGRELWLRGLIASRDGQRLLRGERSTVVADAGDAATLGDALGTEFLARGAAPILAEAL